MEKPFTEMIDRLHSRLKPGYVSGYYTFLDEKYDGLFSKAANEVQEAFVEHAGDKPKLVEAFQKYIRTVLSKIDEYESLLAAKNSEHFLESIREDFETPDTTRK